MIYSKIVLLSLFLSLAFPIFSQGPSQVFLNDSLKANNYVEQALKLRGKGDFSNALNSLDSAMVIRNLLNDTSGIANIYALKSTVFQYQGKQEKAIKFLLQALKIHEKINDQKGIAIDCNNLALIYNAQKDYPKAEEYFLLSLALFEKMKGTEALEATANILFNLSRISNNQNNLEKGLEYGKKSAEINTLLNNKTGLALSYNSIGNAYLSLQKLQLAESNYLKSLNHIPDVDYPSLKASNLHQLSKIYLEQNQLEKAEKFVDEAKSLFKKIGNSEDLRDTYLTLSQIYKVKDQPYKALVYYQNYHKSYEEIFNKESDRAKKELLAIYETEKKEAEIVILEKDKQLKAEAIKQQRSQIVSFAIGGFLLTLLATGLVYYSRKIQLTKDQIAFEKERSERLLLNILPEDVAVELKENGKYRAQSIPQVSVLFADISDFTKIAENLSPDELVRDIDEYFSAFDEIVGRFGIEKIKTIGDAYMVAGGLKGDPVKTAIQTVRAGIAFQDAVREINSKRQQFQKSLFELRIGIHTGLVVAGIVGSRKFAYDIWGDTVNIASRMESSGEVNKVNISQSTFELVKDEFNCKHRGKINAKNKGDIEMYFVEKKKPTIEQS